ncbi:tRNA uridine-5-carboxymethylaminomethyl(34) synthesis enzyme MnmG [Qipengyuania sp. JC766]|uniref:tRNA uridine-5-carboxymethylaminomethyl(34) synthesis enzyme MnmG n=1 Tax=Qipengyuania sp. JC766 TaxID=3232139 RepID=UPI0034584D02
MNEFQVLVVGGGHAGVEAARAAARMGAATALVTFDKDTVGAMSCNPAIGGLGKGHLVREVDALDGVIGRAADAAAIHYRMLNRSKGSAVWGPRIQADRRLFRESVQSFVATQEGLVVVEGEVAALRLEGGRVGGLELSDGTLLSAPRVILCTGTFLGGKLFRGEERFEGGRIGEAAASRLGLQMREADLPLARLKTGTPPRLDGRTIEWAQLDVQPSEANDWTMSPLTKRRKNPELFCAITRTTEAAHEIIRKNLDRSPLFSGAIGAAGPRYCPSIEDKIHRFGDRDGHQIFLEPEALDSPLIYPNGISTSLPVDVQHDMLRAMPGLEHVEMAVPGYAVEYDHIDPRALDSSLQVEAIPGLYCAGQINGTTGYEEAAAQGLVAGLAAAAAECDTQAPALDRSNSYIAVMIDDLTLHGVSEPYRMLTARAEYRLRLRANNAHTRLTPLGIGAGCIGDERRRWFERRAEATATLRKGLARTATAKELKDAEIDVRLDQPGRSLKDWLRLESVTPESIAPLLGDINLDSSVMEELAEDALYEPYLVRQDAELRDLQSGMAVSLGRHFDYTTVPGLSNEMVERLSNARPQDMAAASRVAGITPSALAAILVQARRRNDQAA